MHFNRTITSRLRGQRNTMENPFMILVKIESLFLLLAAQSREWVSRGPPQQGGFR